jgi:hypothetical protein
MRRLSSATDHPFEYGESGANLRAIERAGSYRETRRIAPAGCVASAGAESISLNRRS